MNVVLIVFDSLRADHIGAYGNDWIHTPNLDAFARESVLFTDSYPESLPTLPFRQGLCTGQRVFPYHGFQRLKGDTVGAPGWGPIPEEHDTLAELLSASGYRTGLVSDLYHTFKPSRNFHRGFGQWTWIRGQEQDRYRSRLATPDEVRANISVGQREDAHLNTFLGQYLANVRDRDVEERYFPAQVFSTAARWLQENDDADQIFLTIEEFDPHEPWDPPAHYRRLYDPDDDLPDGIDNVIQSPYRRWDEKLTERELRRIQANYAGEVTLCDRWFGYFMDALKASGRLDDSLVIVVSDHGHCLAQPGDKDFVGKRGYPMTKAVGQLVTLVRLPGAEHGGVRSDAILLSTDIPATILAAAGVEPDGEIHGRDFRPAIVSGAHREHVTVASWGTIVTVVDDEWWYNASIWGDQPLLYRHREDELLERNLASERPDVCERMQQAAVQDAGGDIPASFEEYRKQPWCSPETTP